MDRTILIDIKLLQQYLRGQIACSRILTTFFYFCDAPMLIQFLSRFPFHNRIIRPFRALAFLYYNIIYIDVHFIDFNSYPFPNSFSIYFNANEVQINNIYIHCIDTVVRFSSIFIRVIIILYTNKTSKCFVLQVGIYPRSI